MKLTLMLITHYTKVILFIPFLLIFAILIFIFNSTILRKIVLKISLNIANGKIDICDYLIQNGNRKLFEMAVKERAKLLQNIKQVKTDLNF